MRSKAHASQLNLPHGISREFFFKQKNKKEKLKTKTEETVRSRARGVSPE